MITFALTLLFFTNIGHNLILSCGEKYLRSKNIELQINGINRDITQIKEIHIKTPDNMEILLSNITLKRKNLFSKSIIYVGNLILKGTNQKSDNRKNLQLIIPSMKIVRKFISQLTIKQGNLDFGDNNIYNINNLTYISSGIKDYLSTQFNDIHKLLICMSWDMFECENVIINFENLFGFTASVNIKTPEKENTKYNFSAQNSKLRITGAGSYTDFISNILVESLSILHEQKMYKLSGIISPEKEEIHLNTKIPMCEYIQNLPTELRKNFPDTINFSCKLGKNREGIIDIYTLKSEKTLGNMKCVLLKDDLIIDGNIDWINIHGFQLKKLKCTINKFKSVDILLIGSGFNIRSQSNIEDKSIIVDNFELEIPQNGYIKSTSKFTLRKDMECPFEFAIKNLDFFNKIAPLSGNITGYGKYKNGSIKLKNKSQTIKFKNHQINDLDLDLDAKDISFTAKNAIIFGSKFSNLNANIKDEILNINFKTSNNFNVSANGKISKSYKKISLDNCNINSAHSKIDIKTFDLNFIDKCYKIYCEIIDDNTKGIIDIHSQNNVCNVALNLINTELIRKIIDPKIPQCIIDGKMSFDSSDDFINGKGSLKIFGLISPKNTIDIDILLSDNGLKLNANLINSNEFFKIDADVPFALKSDGSIIKNDNSQINCSIKGNTKIQNLLELSDGIDARGILNCDVKFYGDTTNPILEGNIAMQNAYFIINDITLKNGSILLRCNGNTIYVINANFLDYRGKRLNITGNAKFFFDNFMPNINTNLKLNFDNFMLFDSDNMRIVANGSGAITGKINDLTIDGNVELPKCKILKFSTDDNNNDDEIIIENEKHIQKKITKEEPDFCKYDIKMSCPKIEIVGKAFEIDLLGNLKLLTYQNKSTMTGNLKLSNGRVSIFGKRMKMSSGSVKFLKEYPFDPNAHFLCENSFADLIAYLEIENKPQKGVSLNLYSRPNYSQDVILSNIMFGKSTKYLNVTEAAQLAHAVASLKNNGGYIFSILNAFQKIGIIDNISITTNSQKTEDTLLVNEQSSNNENQGINISAGKYIHDNIYVSVNKNSEDETASFDVDLSITDTLSVKANTNGEAGISWKYRY